MSAEVDKRIKLVSTSRSGSPLSPRDIGTVWRVTPVGTLRVVWDKGCRFDLNPGTDQWEILPEES
jgi:hypothetical protein